MVYIYSPQQQIYNEVYKVCLALGYPTFDYLPANDVGYPFVFIGEQFDQDKANKTIATGNVQQTIHLYHDYTRRGDLANMVVAIKSKLRELKHTKNFYISVNSINSRVIPDNTTAQSLLHGVIEVDFKFN